MKMEHVRMRLAHESVTQDLVDMELIELKFIFDRRKFVSAVLSTTRGSRAFVQTITTTGTSPSFLTINPAGNRRSRRRLKRSGKSLE